MSGEGDQQDVGARQDRGKSFCFPEIMYCLFAALDTNEKFSPIGTIHHNDKVTDMTTCVKLSVM